VAKLKAWVENLTLKIELEISHEWAIIRAFVAKLKAWGENVNLKKLGVGVKSELCLHTP